MKNLSFLLLLTILVCSCSLTKNTHNCDDLKADASAPLIHTVYLELKDDLNPDQVTDLLAAIKNVADIPQVKGLKIGEFADLKDKRALSHLDLVFQMGFNSEADYQAYQAHKIHLALKEVAKKYLAAPPTTHDFYQID